MSLLKDVGVHHFLPGRAMLLLTLMLMLGACATAQLQKDEPPPLHHSGPKIQIADVDVLALSPEMEEFLEHYILKYSNTHTRMYMLMHAVTKNGVLGFDYDESLSLTAAEAFEKRRGNCVSFANMFVALARRSGLNAYYQEVFKLTEWSSHEHTVLQIKHINVVIEDRTSTSVLTQNQAGTYVIDVSGQKINLNVRRRIISDSYAKALYLNNLGVEVMFKGDLPTAYAYMRQAIKTEPLLTDSWVNIAVLFGRNEQLDEAETALKMALQIDDTEYSAMSNLYEVYLAQEDLESAAELQAKVENYRLSNPHYLLKMSDEALEHEQFEESISLLQRAIKKKENDHMLHFALAKTQFLSGEISAAEDSLARARELAPQSMISYYNRPMLELLTEE